ncbi:valine--tRNA ligase [Rhizocola hellebori]|uniref:valine--tRNA ligase n=1 Tax=Rhizocola hellebori TaxID=1392758 RepID=A0A8J3QAW8_9ACTN|nr:valine--tRNA ligase [Rhizocola hellebori]GIH06397.1 valine--tRNA ligase [Rhizocola hellebori]
MKPDLDSLSRKWTTHWEQEQTYRFDRDAPADRVYAIDTPPPTASGELHMGSVFGYVQADVIARFQRMQGKTVFYPMGWDDNGLPTERRVQRYYGVRCDPSLPYEADLSPPMQGEKPVSRRNFTELCHQLTELDEKSFEEVFRTVGLSVDWSLLYTTIGDRARAVSQQAFLDAYSRGDAYRAHAPTLWDTTFGTAVAQAETEDRLRPSAYHTLYFGPIAVKTTRPELLPACVALVAHPDDARYQPLFGTSVATPVFGQPVPVLSHRLADPAKGTGIAMICTFGDTTDVIWQRELDLPVKPVLGFDGRFLPEVDHLGGLTVAQGRTRVLELLPDTAPEPIEHPVKFYERGDRPLEIIASGQWYVRNGGRDAQLRETLLEHGRELSWHPPHMQVRYEHWVNGLTGDWLVSRQRYFGVPIPLWYPLSGDGEPDYAHPILPSSLPMDPSTDSPPGFDEAQRGKPGGFIGEPDVLDTWATSTLTPTIAGFTGQMDLRPQGPEIIRTWLFGTVVRYPELPWKHAMINGWILDPNRKKMSKSVGNVVTPIALLHEHSPDAVRYWAAAASPGTDTAFDTGQMRVGRRLATKILNAAQFVLGFDASPAEPDHPLDLAMLTALGQTVDEATKALHNYDYARALAVTERFFWRFCDDYLELVKARAYEGSPSARAALRHALDVLLRLFAPMLPFVTEEAWSWFRPGSIHRAPWPAPVGAQGNPALLALAADAIGAVRRAKSAAHTSMRTPLATLTVHSDDATWTLLQDALPDLRNAGVITTITHAQSSSSPQFETSPLS